MKYLLITGGVISGLGKGVCSSSLGHLLQARGHNITMIKIDPYLNIDAGTLSPYEHGECYVLADGTEVDLDFGTYERFLNIELKGVNSITAGKIYKTVLSLERKGEYLGKTVQMVPHVTDQILNQIEEAADKSDICIIELGGTVGDIECAIFLESLRQLRFHNEKDFCHVHLSLIPKMNGEQKSKPTQHSYRELRHAGLTPDFIFCRCEEPITKIVQEKVSKFCMVPKNRVISVYNVDNIYYVPKLFLRQKVDEDILNRLGLNLNEVKLTSILEMVQYSKTIKIGIVGKYQATDAYISLYKAIFHACNYLKMKPEIISISPEGKMEELKSVSCIIVPGGFGTRGFQGKIKACQYARENKIPFLGICLGFQVAVIEYFRNVLGEKKANSQEVINQKHSLFVRENDEKNLGGTMRKGSKKISLVMFSRLNLLYGKYFRRYEERFRHRYKYNEKDFPLPENNELAFTIMSEKEKVGFELAKKIHPYYIGVQFHPEYISRFGNPHPLFVGLLKTKIN